MRSPTGLGRKIISDPLPRNLLRVDVSVSHFDNKKFSDTQDHRFFFNASLWDKAPALRSIGGSFMGDVSDPCKKTYLVIWECQQKSLMCFPGAFKKTLQPRNVHNGSVTDSTINQPSRGARVSKSHGSKISPLIRAGQLDCSNSEGGTFPITCNDEGYACIRDVRADL